MNDDYLWDKQGSDPEIERLELQLSGFSLRRELRAPAILGNEKKMLLLEKLGLWFPIRPRFVMACLLLLSGVVSTALLFSYQPAAGIQIAEGTMLRRPVLVPINDAENSESEVIRPEVKRVAEAVHFISRRESSRSHLNRKKSSVRRMPPAVTAEEQYAYDQLMLALSITGSKLRDVKEMANGAPSKISSDSIR